MNWLASERSYIPIACSIVILLLPGHASAIEWSRTFEGTEQDTVAAVLETSTGELLIAGWNNKQFIKGDNYIWILKLDRNGKQMWRQSFSDGGSYPDSNFSAIATADSGFLFYWTRSSGPGNENVRICKINADGLIEWQQFHGGSGNDRITTLIQTSDGGYCATGWTNKTLGASNYDLWVLRLDHNGTVCWQKTYGGNSSDKGTSIIQLPDSGYLIAGWTYSFGNGACEIWALRLNRNGQVIWQKTCGLCRATHVPTISYTSDDSYMITSYELSATQYNVHQIALSADGNIANTKSYDGTYQGIIEKAHSVKKTVDHGYVLAGRTLIQGARYRDIWLMKINPNGLIAWQKMYGGLHDDYAEAIHQNNDGGYTLTGWTYSFGAGNRLLWVLRLNPDGDIAPENLNKPVEATSNGRLIVSVPAFSTDNEDRILSFHLTGSHELLITISGPRGYRYSFNKTNVKRIHNALIEALSIVETYKTKQMLPQKNLLFIHEGSMSLSINLSENYTLPIINRDLIPFRLSDTADKLNGFHPLYLKQNAAATITTALLDNIADLKPYKTVPDGP